MKALNLMQRVQDSINSKSSKFNKVESIKNSYSCIMIALSNGKNQIVITINFDDEKNVLSSYGLENVIL